MKHLAVDFYVIRHLLISGNRVEGNTAEAVSPIPNHVWVGAAIFTIVSNEHNESQVQESRALYKHLNIMKGKF